MTQDLTFQLVSPHQPAGDQPKAIAAIVEGLRAGRKHQILHGITGSGKTFTIASVIQAVQRPSLIISPNKTLADQIHGEIEGFFPHNEVRPFISDYLVFQPQRMCRHVTNTLTRGPRSTRC
jgi:excinuclease ABC subunit B